MSESHSWFAAFAVNSCRILPLSSTTTQRSSCTGGPGLFPFFPRFFPNADHSPAHLDWITHYARERGAVVRMLGDPAQLSSVEAGGALRLLAQDAGAVELTDLHRFSDRDEAIATIGIREGRPEALDFYLTHDRIHSGSTDAMLEAAYAAWAHDIQAGLRSLLVAQSGNDVTALNTRARRARTEAGLVTQAGIELRDGTCAGVGDLIVTRHNQRQLTSRDGNAFVKNGDTWTVERQHSNGDLTVRNIHDRRQGAAPPRLRRVTCRAGICHHGRACSGPHR
jgi:hypothetical protein